MDARTLTVGMRQLIDGLELATERVAEAERELADARREESQTAGQIIAAMSMRGMFVAGTVVNFTVDGKGYQAVLSPPLLRRNE